MSNYPAGVCEANAPWNVPDNRDLYTCSQCTFRYDVFHFDSDSHCGSVCTRNYDSLHQVEWVTPHMPACDDFDGTING